MWPDAQARLASPKARARSRPAVSEASESRAIAGAQNAPSDATAASIARPMSTTVSGSGRSPAITTAPARPTRIGARRPWRSESRPLHGLSTASAPATTRKMPPMTAPEAPSSSSRSGASTSSTPGEDRREGEQPERHDHRPAPQRPAHAPASRHSAPAGIPGIAPGPGREPGRQHGHAAEHDLRAEQRGKAAEGRAEQHPDDRRAERRADHGPALVCRRGAHEPGEAARPRAGPAHSLGEARDVQQEHALGEAEDQARDGEQRQSERARSA